MKSHYSEQPVMYKWNKFARNKMLKCMKVVVVVVVFNYVTQQPDGLEMPQ